MGMQIGHSIASVAGKLLRRFRAGDHKLAMSQVGQPGRALRVESDSFAPGGRIAEAQAGRQGKSPSLHIQDVPPETQELVLIAEDPDAPMPRPFVHWVVVGLRPDQRDLPEGGLPAGARVGKNTMRGAAYMGPAPPPGHGTHHYHFEVFALDQPLGALDQLTRDSVIERMRGHVLASGDLVGTYER